MTTDGSAVSMTGNDKPSSTSSPERRRGRLFVVAGPSGVGKDTLIQELLGRWPLYLSVSATTRPPRGGEVDGRDYTFVSEDQFRSMIVRGEFLEWAEVFGNHYGTSREWLAQAVGRGFDIILES